MAEKLLVEYKRRYIEKTDNILYKIKHNISLIIELLYKISIAFALVLFGKKSTLVLLHLLLMLYCLTISYEINMRQKLTQGQFCPNIFRGILTALYWLHQLLLCLMFITIN